jgi:2-oxoglutarate ferredoxin oxidoreductase subunit delta
MPARAIELLVDRSRCKSCGLCVKFCPQKVLVISDELNFLGYNSVAPQDISKCTGCGVCYTVCPDMVFEIIKGEA